MKTFLILFISIYQLLYAEPSLFNDPVHAPVASDQEEPASNIDSLFSNIAQGSSGVSLSATQLPSHIFIGQILPVTIKLTPLEIASGHIEYSLQREEGVQLFSDTPQRSIKDDGVYDTFYFLVQSGTIRLPDIIATVASTGAVSATLGGSSLVASPLSPPATYANVLATAFKVIDYKTTSYNQESNIVVFTVHATRCNIGTFSLPNVIKQGFESKIPNVDQSQMTYYAIIPKSAQTLDFSIFNVTKNRYESISIPIVVDDDTVSTQSDISPTDGRHTELKIGAAAILTVLLIGTYYWRREQWALIASIFPFFFAVYMLLPNNDICVKKGSPIYLLPISHGTIFEMTMEDSQLESLNTVGSFTKVRLEENKVGWVNQRDLCTH